MKKFSISRFIGHFHLSNIFCCPKMTIPELEEEYLDMNYSSTEMNTLHLKIRGEGHTLGNLLADKFYNDPRCTFSAYKVPHPLEEVLELKITARKDVPVVNLLKETLKNLSQDVSSLLSDVQQSKESKQQTT